MRTFTVVWSGQLVSLLGSGLTAFALAVWVFQTTGSVTDFTLIALATALPGILVSPFAGALVDRWDRRWALIAADLGAGLGIGLLALLTYSGRLALWHIYFLLCLRSCFTALQFPALGAAVTLLVGKRHLGRANGMLQVADAAGRIAAPVLAGALMIHVQLWSILLLDLATFGVSLGTLFAVRFPRPEAGPSGRVPERRSLLREIAAGWRYLATLPGLLGLLALLTAGNFTLGTVQALLGPMVLGFTSEAALGLVLSIGSCGLLVGGGLVSLWGGPRHRVRSILAFKALEGFSLMVVGGVGRSVPWIAAADFTLIFSSTIVMAASQSIWQSKVPVQLQGRAFAIRRMIAWSTLPLAYLVAGPLTEGFFEPLMAPGGALPAVGKWLGEGRGRGIGLYFVLLGALQVLLVLAACFYRPLRHLEAEIPDALADAFPAGPAAAPRRLEDAASIGTGRRAGSVGV